jgi:hypothetical protein
MHTPTVIVAAALRQTPRKETLAPWVGAGGVPGATPWHRAGRMRAPRHSVGSRLGGGSGGGRGSLGSGLDVAIWPIQPI